MFVLFFFKQKTAYEMRISDWSSDVCSSDLVYISNIEELNSILTIVTNNAYDYDSDRDLALRHEQLLRDLNARIEEEKNRFLSQGICTLNCTECEDERANQEEIGRASCRERVCQYV